MASRSAVIVTAVILALTISCASKGYVRNKVESETERLKYESETQLSSFKNDVLAQLKSENRAEVDRLRTELLDLREAMSSIQKTFAVEYMSIMRENEELKLKLSQLQAILFRLSDASEVNGTSESK